MPIGPCGQRPLWDRKIRISACMLFSTMMLALTACGQTQTPATSSDPLADPRLLATPAGNDGRFSVDTSAAFINSGETKNKWVGDIKPFEIRQGGSLGALGLNLDTYFAGDISDTGARLDRLEGIVNVMHRDLKILAPSLQRLALIETDLQELVSQLETMLHEQGSAPQTAPLPLSPPETGVEQTSESLPPPDKIVPPEHLSNKNSEPLKTQPETPPAAPAGEASATISAIRFGGEGGKTRIVLDAKKPLAYTKDLDNKEKLLVIDIPKMSWGAAKQGKAPTSSAIDSWSAQPNNHDGTTLVIALKKTVTISYEGILQPESNNPHYRIVIDLKPE